MLKCDKFNKAKEFLNLFEASTIVVAFLDPGVPKKEYFENTHIFIFHLWNVPTSDPMIIGNRVVRSYVGLFENMAVLDRKELRKYNSTKQRVSVVRDEAEKIHIPDSVWNRLKIFKPSKDQRLLLQSLNIIFNKYRVRLFGMENFGIIKDFWGY